MNDFINAYNYASLVINSTNYNLETTLKTRYSTTASSESILKVTNINGQHEPGGRMKQWYSGRTSLPYFRIPEPLFNYVKGFLGDKRLAYLNNTKYSGSIYLNKYDSFNFEMPLVTLTEMYLTRAECAGEVANTIPTALTTGITDINKIIERAYGNNSKNLALTITGDQLISNARIQREIEMIGEGDRLHQIKRIGAHPLPSRRVERLDRRGSEWNCPGFILQFPDYEKNANAAFQLNVEGGCL